MGRAVAGVFQNTQLRLTDGLFPAVTGHIKESPAPGKAAGHATIGPIPTATQRKR